MPVIGGDQYITNEKSTSGPRKGRVISNDDPKKKELKKGYIIFSPFFKVFRSDFK